MKKLWKKDDELFALARRELYSAVVGDIMDQLKMYHQFLPATIKPLQREMVIVGRAMTVLEADWYEADHERSQNPMGRKPFGFMLEALDDLKLNEIYICTGCSHRYALWGELMSVRAMKCGAVGAVIDGYSRDTQGIIALDFPTFSIGSYAQDQAPRGKVIDFRVPVEIDGIRIASGDILVGDVDGICVVPQAAETEVFVRALAKARAEKRVKQSLEGGMTAKTAFKKYRVL
ncbi:MAG TPA: RraA family protein [Candidatus Angelobacter sp.]